MHSPMLPAAQRIASVVVAILVPYLFAPAGAAAACKCSLPFAEGTTVRVSQSWRAHGSKACLLESSNPGSHVHDQLQYAIDFAVPLGTEVVAAYEGWVKRVVNNSDATTGWGNYVLIDHRDGNLTLYSGLSKGTIVVAADQYVCRGRKLGLSGQTGEHTGPYLHFQVQHADDFWSRSFNGFEDLGCVVPSCVDEDYPTCDYPDCKTRVTSGNTKSTSASECFRAEYVDQSQSPLQNVWVLPNTPVNMSIRYRNVGGATWLKDAPDGVSNPRHIELRSVAGDCSQTNGVFYHPPSWVNAIRITDITATSDGDDTAENGDIATFSFIGQAPAASGDYHEDQWVAPYAASTCVNGWAGANFSLLVDGTPPRINWSCAAGTYSTDQTISFSVADDHSGIAGYCMSWDNAARPASPCSPGSSGSTTLSAAGAAYTWHTLYVHAYDRAGNQATFECGSWMYTPSRIIRATHGSNGEIVPKGDVVVPYGGNQAFAMDPDDHFHVADVIVDGVSQGPRDSYTFTNVTADHSIHATFAIDQYSLPILPPDGCGSVTRTPDQPTYAHGSTVVLTANPCDCWHFVSWTDGSTVNPRTVLMDGPKSMGAVFRINEYTISGPDPPHGSVKPALPVTIPCGSLATFTFNADDCYHLADVKVDGVSVGPVPTYTFSNVRANHTIEPIFEIDPYTIRATAGPNGAISPAGDVIVGCGTNPPFTVTPDPCHHIAEILLDQERLTLGEAMARLGGTLLEASPQGPSAAASTIVRFTNVRENHSIHATFARDTFTITAVPPVGGGSISPPGDTAVLCGEDLAYTFPAAPDFHVANVYMDDIPLGPLPGFTFRNVRQDHTIRAEFATIILATAGPHGSIAPSDSVPVLYGADRKFSIAADPCYRIEDVIVDGRSIGPESTYTFTNVTGPHTISATFTIQLFTIAATADTGGVIEPAGDIVVSCGSDQKFDIVPDACHRIRDVLVDGNSMGPLPSYTFPDVTGPHTIHATFDRIVYAIAASADTGGTIESSKPDLVNCGDDRTYTIRPDACHTIRDVLVDGVSMGPLSAYTFANVTGPHTIHATFDRIVYAVAASADTGGTIESPKPDLVNCGDDRTYTIRPDACHTIRDVLVDGVSMGPLSVYTFPHVTGPHTIHATFERIVYAVAASADTGGTIESPKPDLVNCGDDRTYTIRPDSCHTIRDVRVDGVSMGPLSAYAFANVTGPHTIHATFDRIVYAITASADTGGTIESAKPDLVNCGDDRTYTIRPDACHVIRDVLVDGNSMGPLPSYTFAKVTGPHTIHATFDRIAYTITASADTGGTIEPDGPIAVNCDGSLTFTITPDNCHLIRDVLVDGVSMGAISSYTFDHVDRDHTIRATFTRIVYSIAASAGAHGSITPSGAVPVNCGGDQRFVMTPEAHYHVLDVQVNGRSVGAVLEYTFRDVRSDSSIHAEFTIDTHALTVTVIGQGDVLLNPPGGVYDYGTVVALTAVPAAGWHFVGWSGDASGAATETQVTMDGDKAVTATFAITFLVEIKPRVLNLRSSGRWITAILTVPAPFEAADVDDASVRLNGTVPISSDFPSRINGNQITYKFDRAAVHATLQPGEAVPVAITGSIEDWLFGGVDTIRVIVPTMHAPAAGAELVPGSQVEVTWDLPLETESDVTLLFTSDDGATWIVQQASIPNSGRSTWTVPSEVTRSARLAVVQIWKEDESGFVNEAEFAESGTFAIGGALAVERRPSTLALDVPNPAGPGTRFSIALPTTESARITIYDVTGRIVGRSELDAGIGRQQFSLGRLPAGVYLARLTQGGRAITRRFIALR